MPSLLTTATIVAVVSAAFTACTLPPLSRVIYRIYSDAWPPAMEQKVRGYLEGADDFAAVSVALDLGIFDLIAELQDFCGKRSVLAAKGSLLFSADEEKGSCVAPRRDAAAIAAALGANERGIETLLERLSAMDLLRIPADTGILRLIIPEEKFISATSYELGKAARTHLVRGKFSEQAQGILPSLAELYTRYQYLGGLGALNSDLSAEKARQTDAAKAAVMRGGALPAESLYGAGQPFWTMHASSSLELSLGPASKLADMLQEKLSPHQLGQASVLDVGAGSGAYSYVMGRRHAEMRLTLLDLPHVLPRLKATAERFDLAPPDHAEPTYLGGSAFDEPLAPQSFDLILLSHFLSLHGHEDNAKASGRTDLVVTHAAATRSRSTLSLHVPISFPLRFPCCSCC